MIDYKLLEKCPVFKGLSENESQKLLGEIHYQIKNFKKDDLIAIAGEPAINLYIILSGSVRGEMMDYSGKTIKIEDIEAPRPLATAFLFGNKNRFPVTVTANTDAKILPEQHLFAQPVSFRKTPVFEFQNHSRKSGSFFIAAGG